MSAISLRLEGHEHPIRISLTAWQRMNVDRATISAGESLTTWAVGRLQVAARVRGVRGSETDYERAAARAGLDLTTWIRVILLEAAGMTDLRDQLRRVTR